MYRGPSQHINNHLFSNVQHAFLWIWNIIWPVFGVLDHENIFDDLGNIKVYIQDKEKSVMHTNAHPGHEPEERTEGGAVGGENLSHHGGEVVVSSANEVERTIQLQEQLQKNARGWIPYQRH